MNDSQIKKVLGFNPNRRHYATKPIREKFWSLVNKSRGARKCWPFFGQIDKRGYGRFSCFGTKQLAHRIAWMLTVNHFDPSLFICHRCDNPPCCNPKHLFEGNQTSNMRDCANKRRFPNRKGENSNFAILTEREVRKIIKSYKPYVVTRKMLSKKYGVSCAAVKDIIEGRNWSHIHTTL